MFPKLISSLCELTSHTMKRSIFRNSHKNEEISFGRVGPPLLQTQGKKIDEESSRTEGVTAADGCTRWWLGSIYRSKEWAFQDQRACSRAGKRYPTRMSRHQRSPCCRPEISASSRATWQRRSSPQAASSGRYSCPLRTHAKSTCLVHTQGLPC